MSEESYEVENIVETMKYQGFMNVVIICVAKAVVAKSQNNSSYKTEQFGSLYSDDYRLFFKRADNDTPISPMHDIPL